MIENDYCFAVSWADDDKAEPYVIRATDRDKAWEKLCIQLTNDSLSYETGQLYGIELQLVKIPEDHRHKFCHECGERLGANPVLMDGYYWHEACADVEDERKASEAL